LLVYSTHGRHIKTQQPLPLGEHNTDGVLVFVNSISDKTLKHFHNINFPAVLIHRRSPEGLQIPSVTIENKEGAIAVMNHLIEEHGYQRIAFLRGDLDQEDTYLREQGYRESLTAHQLPVDPQLIARGDFDRATAEEAVSAWLTQEAQIDAIFAADDESAIGVLSAVHNAGLHVPEDIAVVGFDDTYLSGYLNPPLTTVRALTEQVGSQATLQLIKLIQGEDAELLTLLPTELIVRRSCGCL
jgi:DNA-binding LacI/PurR family transcriptional regulator